MLTQDFSRIRGRQAHFEAAPIDVALDGVAIAKIGHEPATLDPDEVGKFLPVEGEHQVLALDVAAKCDTAIGKLLPEGGQEIAKQQVIANGIEPDQQQRVAVDDVPPPGHAVERRARQPVGDGAQPFEESFRHGIAGWGKVDHGGTAPKVCQRARGSSPRVLTRRETIAFHFFGQVSFEC